MDALHPPESLSVFSSLGWLLRFRPSTITQGMMMTGDAVPEHAETKEANLTLAPVKVQSLSPIALAYIGDAVYELFVRGLLLWPPKRIQDYHHQVVNQVKAEQQASYVEQIMPFLAPEEQDVLRRGRNASPRGPKRVDGAIYQRATGFETLIGYLYLTNPERLAEVLSYLELSA
jgi:ribonuclease-3 family protein